MRIGVGVKYINCTIKEYLDLLSARTPTPGGGSTAALFGAVACALAEMVVNYSDNKNKTIKKAKTALKRQRSLFMALVDEDAVAYKRLISEKTQQAYKNASLVPLKVCSLSSHTAWLVENLASLVNERLLSDIDCAKAGFTAAFKAAKVNVFINLKSIKDKKFVNAVKKEISGMEKILWR